MRNRNFLQKGIALLCVVALVVVAALPQVFAEGETTEYTPLKLSDFQLTDDTIQGGDATGNTTQGGTLQNISIEGIYNFTQKTDGNCIYFGGVWKGVRVEPLTDGSLLVTYVDENYAQVYGDVILPTDAGMRLTGTDLKMKMSFAFANEAQGVGDLKLTIGLGDTYERVVNFPGVTIENLQQTIYLWSSSAENPLSYSMASYDEMTLYGYGFGEETIVDGGDGVAKTLSTDKTLNKTAITGTYQFQQKTDVNCVYFGGTWQGVRIEPLANGSLLVTYVNDAYAQTYGGEITKDEVGVDITGKDVDVDIRTSFQLLNESGTTADLRLGVTINDTYTEYFKFRGAATSTLKQTVFAYSSAGNPLTLKSEKPEQEIVKPNMTPFTLQEAGISNGKYVGNPPHLVAEGSYSDSLMNKSLTQRITFSEHAGSQLNYGGGPSAWHGVNFITQADGTILFAAAAGEFIASDVLTPEIAGHKLLGEEIELTIELFEDGNDVMMGVSINGRLYNNDYFRLVGGKGNFGNNIGLYIADPKGSIRVGREVIKPELTPVSFEDFDILEREYTCDAPNLVAQGAYKTSLVGTVFTDKITFSDHAGNYLNYAGGPSAWHGIRFISQEDGTILMVSAAGEFIANAVLTPEIAGTKLLGEEIELTIELFENGTNVNMGVYLNGNLYNNDYFVLAGATGNLGSYVGVYIENVDGKIQVGPAEGAPVINPEFKKIGFHSYFCVYSGTYGWNETNSLAVNGSNGLDSMDKVVFSDTVNFTDTPGASLRLAGKESPWHGLVIESIGNGTLRMLDAVGCFANIYFESDVAGVQLTDNDVKLTMSFEYVDADRDGEVDDVKLGVWFNDKPYNDKWIYLKDYAGTLGEYMGIYSSVKESTLTITTSELGIDFEEYGFTKKWKALLGIK